MKENESSFNVGKIKDYLKEKKEYEILLRGLKIKMYLKRLIKGIDTRIRLKRAYFLV